MSLYMELRTVPQGSRVHPHLTDEEIEVQEQHLLAKVSTREQELGSQSPTPPAPGYPRELLSGPEARAPGLRPWPSLADPEAWR